MIGLMLAVFAVAQGTYSYFFKRTQQDHIRRVSQSIFFVAVNSLFQLIFLLILPPWQPIRFSSDAWVLGAEFTVFYAAGAVLLIKALSLGPMSLTNVITIIRNFIPIAAGLLLWKEGVTWNAALGILVFIGAIVLINSPRSYESQKLSAKWAIISLASGVIYGVAVCFSKEYGFRQPGSPREYLLAYNAVILVLATPYIIIKRKSIGLPGFITLPFIGKTAMAALAQDGMNIIFMMYINRFSSAVYFPMTAILGVLSATAVGFLIFREKITVRGWLGIGLGLGAIVLLNL